MLLLQNTNINLYFITYILCSEYQTTVYYKLLCLLVYYYIYTQFSLIIIIKVIKTDPDFKRSRKKK